MSATYNLGEQKIRPGVYRRYEKAGTSSVVSAIYGVFAIPVQAEFGPLGAVTVHTEASTLKKLYGTSGTVDAALSLFDGGATKVLAYRLGTGGTKGTLDLKDTTTGTAVAVVTLTTRYETDKTFSVTVREKLADDTRKEFLVYDGTNLLETLEFAADGTTEVATLIETINNQSAYFTASKKADGNGTIAEVSTSSVTAGTAPTVVNNDYSTAFDAFEAYKWNMLVLDTVSTEVQAVAKAYVDRIFNTGALGVVALGEPTKTVTYANRLAHAKAFNDEKVIYLGSGYKNADGVDVDGYLAIATQAGIIGSTPSNKSVTHMVIPNAVDTLETLTNGQYEDAIKSGLLLLSVNDEGQVWFDSAINTLVTPAANQDDGWKKIRRTSTRFELFDRIDRTLAPLIGRINCDSEGIADVVTAGQKVIDAMVQEKKLQLGAKFSENTAIPYASDYAYFVIEALDYDSLEKIYLTYQFKFAEE